ncbi:transglycosylase SLT domain-containing protein [Peterkaempfera sp. SMS 1(5)a]|uniref:aggregation-promoting factor C-terminal-like domain-containing protein n=1 Tax=Peterkaempfera podocarpi TaxID=3232308 RepID=UPI00366C344C
MRFALPRRLHTTAAVLATTAGLASVAAIAAPAASAATAQQTTRTSAHHQQADARTFAATTGTSAAAAKALAKSMVPASQWASFNQIVSHESSWNMHATNAASGAYGLCQALPGSKMASAGSDWRTNPATQIKWAMTYMNDRYGSPNAAWNFWQTHHWY